MVIVRFPSRLIVPPNVFPATPTNETKTGIVGAAPSGVKIVMLTVDGAMAGSGVLLCCGSGSGAGEGVGAGVSGSGGNGRDSGIGGSGITNIVSGEDVAITEIVDVEFSGVLVAVDNIGLSGVVVAVVMAVSGVLVAVSSAYAVHQTEKSKEITIP